MSAASAPRPPLDPDAELMLRVQRGDASAFRTLLERNHQQVLNVAFRYLNDRARAEDVVQETFLRVYEARDRYSPDAPFRAYLLRIASNICLSHLRRRSPVALEPGEADDGGSGSPRGPREVERPGQALLDEELRQRVRAAVETLPERQRLAIVLNKFQGLDYKEVADALGLTVPATKSLLHRARMALKDVLEGYVTGEP